MSRLLIRADWIVGSSRLLVWLKNIDGFRIRLTFSPSNGIWREIPVTEEIAKDIHQIIKSAELTGKGRGTIMSFPNSPAIWVKKLRFWRWQLIYHEGEGHTGFHWSMILWNWRLQSLHMALREYFNIWG